MDEHGRCLRLRRPKFPPTPQGDLTMASVAMLLAQAVLYFAVMSALFRARGQLGMGVFVCALGVMHFLETYLAAVFFIEAPFGLISPGSTVLFSGKLAMILLVYIKEDAETVRQPIYGLFIGNVLMVGIVLLLRLYDVPDLADGTGPDLSFVDQMGILMVLGTTLLFIDAVALILIYERLGKWWPNAFARRAFVSLAIILSFDQLAFFTGLHLVAGTPMALLPGGWIGKLGAAVVYSGLLGLYLHRIETSGPADPVQPVGDVFSKLTYRHRYEELLGRTGVDALTGALDRGRFETLGAAMLADAMTSGRPVSLAILDIDLFKAINDGYGHPMGDEVLRRMVHALKESLRPGDRIFRYGGEEFVVLSEGLGHPAALVLAERLRANVAATLGADLPVRPTVSIGVATVPEDGRRLAELVACADARLYAAKAQGRNRVVGRAGPDEHPGPPLIP